MAEPGSELERIRAEYDRRDAAGASQVYRLTNPGYLFQIQERERAIATLLRQVGVAIDGAEVLDVGCGTGQALQRFVEFGAASGTGIELMEGRIATARAAYPGLRIEQGNAAELPFPDASFGIVTQFTVLSSVLDPDMRRQIAAEMWRVTHPGGAVVSYDMRPVPRLLQLLSSGATRLSQRLRGETAEPGSPGTPIVGVPAAELRALFPGGEPLIAPVTLELGLASIAGRSVVAAELLRQVRPLRTHLLAVLRKPG